MCEEDKDTDYLDIDKIEDFVCLSVEVLLFLPEKQSVKRNGGLQSEKRILSICRRTKSQSQ